ARVVSATGTGWTTRMLRALQPADVSYSRSTIAAFDGVPDPPPLSFQLGAASITGFRSIDGIAAAAAANTNTMTVSDTAILPFGGSIATRAMRQTGTSWTRRIDGTIGVANSRIVNLPDVTLR